MKIPASLTCAVIVVLAGGCKSAVFVSTETKTGLSIAASNNAPSASLSYHRGELAVIPKNTHGTTYAVFGGLDHHYSLGGDGFAIAQTFATGQAAINASQGGNGGASGTAQDGTLYFATGTTFGLSLTSNDATTQSPSLLAGFRRGEGVFIPTKESEKETNSVYADISIVHWPKTSGLARADVDIKASGQNPANLPLRKNAVRIRQKFATGDAAIQFVEDPEVRAKLSEAAGGDPYKRSTEELALAGRLRKRLAAIDKTSVQAATILTAVNAANSPVPDAVRPRDFAHLRDNRVHHFNTAQLKFLEGILNQHAP